MDCKSAIIVSERILKTLIKKLNVTKSYETDIINQKYDFIEEIIEETVVNKKEKTEFTDKIDKVLTHNIWGIPIFLGIMAQVFLITFTQGEFFSSYQQLL